MIIALYANKKIKDSEELITTFVDSTGLANYLQSCFTKLTLSKKERECITGTLLLWHKYLNTSITHIKQAPLLKNRYLHDLYRLLKIISPETDHYILIEQLIADAPLPAPRQPKKRQNKRKRHPQNVK